MGTIYDISQNIKNIYEELADGIGVDTETGEIKPEILNALALHKADLQQKGIDYGYIIKSFDDELEIYDKEIKRLTERKKFLQNTQQRLKETLKNAMLEFDIIEIKGKTLKINFRNSESVEITDERLLDEKFTKIKIEPDKVAIKTALKNGEQVQGAILVQNKNLQIR